jgi:hypothetical protein
MSVESTCSSFSLRADLSTIIIWNLCSWFQHAKEPELIKSLLLLLIMGTLDKMKELTIMLNHSVLEMFVKFLKAWAWIEL